MVDDARLSRLWAADEPLAPDPTFELAVMARVLRRRMWNDIATLVPGVVGAGIALWFLMPIVRSVVDTSSADADTITWLVVALGIAAAVFVVDMIRPGAA